MLFTRPSLQVITRGNFIFEEHLMRDGRDGSMKREGVVYGVAPGKPYGS